MTALTLASIPSHINTYERLAVYAIQCLHNIANGAAVNVATGQQDQPMASCSLGTTADGVDRFILAAYLPVDVAALNSGTEKTWMATRDISQAAPHQNFLSN